jgi:hypothetical protein
LRAIEVAQATNLAAVMQVMGSHRPKDAPGGPAISPVRQSHLVQIASAKSLNRPCSIVQPSCVAALSSSMVCRVGRKVYPAGKGSSANASE